MSTIQEALVKLASANPTLAPHVKATLSVMSPGIYQIRADVVLKANNVVYPQLKRGEFIAIGVDALSVFSLRKAAWGPVGLKSYENRISPSDGPEMEKLKRVVRKVTQKEFLDAAIKGLGMEGLDFEQASLEVPSPNLRGLYWS